jgi:uncharacterized Tic20 family protein
MRGGEKVEIDTQLLLWVAVFLGVLTRTIIPYLRKLREAQAVNKTLTFDVKFAITAFIAVVTSLVTANMLIASIPSELLETTGVQVFLFIFGWAFQHSSNDLFNEMIAT